MATAPNTRVSTALHMATASQGIKPESSTSPSTMSNSISDNEKRDAQLRDDLRPYKRRRLFGALSEMVTLLVGPEEAPFTIHKNTLCEASAFFEDACFDGNTTMKLPEDDPDAVQTMLYWIYHNKLCMPATLFQIKNVAITDGMNTGPGLLAKVFVLGEKYQMGLLRNDIIDAFVLWVGKEGKIPGKVFDYVWSSTICEHSSLRGLLQEYALLNFTTSDLRKMKEDLRPEFLYKLAIEYCIWKECVIQREQGPDCDDMSIDYCPNYQTHVARTRCDEPKRYILTEDS